MVVCMSNVLHVGKDSEKHQANGCIYYQSIVGIAGTVLVSSKPTAPETGVNFPLAQAVPAGQMKGFALRRSLPAPSNGCYLLRGLS